MASDDHLHGVHGRVGGKYAVALFALSLIAFVAETQLTQYVQADLGYRQPLFIFYVVHSSLAIMLPLHFLVLVVSTKTPPRALWAGLLFALRQRLSSLSAPTHQHRLPKWRLSWFLILLTVGATLPGLLWFIAVSLAPITDVTALWNTNAFFAYLLTVRLFKLRWEPLRLAAVILSTLGATAVVYGGSNSSTGSETIASAEPVARAPLVGDLLTLSASILYGAYQVLYKIYAALPNDPEVLDAGIPPQGSYTQVPSESSIAQDEEGPFQEAVIPDADTRYPPPFGLYPNMLTSAIGVCTFLVLWIPILLLHVFDIARFQLPASATEVMLISGIALSGVAFNAGFMILLGVWGPIVTSVGSLLTIVLVFISDIVFGGAVATITTWSLLGSGSIIVAFTILAYDMFKQRHQ